MDMVAVDADVRRAIYCQPLYSAKSFTPGLLQPGVPTSSGAVYPIPQSNPVIEEPALAAARGAARAPSGGSLQAAGEAGDPDADAAAGQQEGAAGAPAPPPQIVVGPEGEVATPTPRPKPRPSSAPAVRPCSGSCFTLIVLCRILWITYIVVDHIGNVEKECGYSVKRNKLQPYRASL